MGKYSKYSHKPKPIIDIIKSKGRARTKDIVKELGYPTNSYRYNDVTDTLTELKERGALLKEGKVYLINPAWDGVIPYKKGPKRNYLRTLLDKNPMTVPEIRQELKESKEKPTEADEGVPAPTTIFPVLSKAKDIKSIGPWGKRIYYLEGQKDLAEQKLEELKLRELGESSNPVLDILDERIQNSKELISKLSSRYNISESGATYHILKGRRRGDIEKVRLSLRGGTGSTSSEIFDGEAEEIYYYKPKDPVHLDQLAQVVIESLPLEKTRDTKRAVTRALKNLNLPKEVYARVKESYRIDEQKKQKFVEELKSFESSPTQEEAAKKFGSGWVQRVCRAFGSWNAAKQAADWETYRRGEKRSKKRKKSTKP